jgi:hypothetical protein
MKVATQPYLLEYILPRPMLATTAGPAMQRPGSTSDAAAAAAGATLPRITTPGGSLIPSGTQHAHLLLGFAHFYPCCADPNRPVTSRSTLASPDRWRPGGSNMRAATAGARQLELARRDKLWINRMKNRVKREIRETDRLINDFDFNEQVAGAFKQEQVPCLSCGIKQCCCD